MTTFNDYEMSNDLSSKSSHSDQACHAQTIGSGPGRRLHKAEIETHFGSYMNMTDEPESKPDTDVHRFTEPTRAYCPRELDPELADLSAIGHCTQPVSQIFVV
jgi:hypothetical protein